MSTEDDGFEPEQPRNIFQFEIIAEAEVTPGPETLARMAAEKAEKDDADDGRD